MRAKLTIPNFADSKGNLCNAAQFDGRGGIGFIDDGQHDSHSWMDFVKVWYELEHKKRRKFAWKVAAEGGSMLMATPTSSSSAGVRDSGYGEETPARVSPPPQRADYNPDIRSSDASSSRTTQLQESQISIERERLAVPVPTIGIRDPPLGKSSRPADRAPLVNATPIPTASGVPAKGQAKDGYVKRFMKYVGWTR